MAQEPNEPETGAQPSPGEPSRERRPNQQRRHNNRRFDRNRSRNEAGGEAKDDTAVDGAEPRKDNRENQNQRNENREPRNENREPRNENREPRNENREPRNEGRDNPNQKREWRPDRRDQRPRERRANLPSISVIIPLLNEEESLNELTSRLLPVLENESGGRYEVIFIDDGSTDKSFEVIRQLHKRNGRIHGVRFRRNYGKSAALAVGFAQAKNDVVITMDADLQDDPLEIPNLLGKLDEGFDLVSGWKKRRKDPLEKRIPSKFFNFVTSVVSGIRLHDFNCGLKAYRNDVVKTVQVYGEMHRYIPALAYWEGFKVAELPVSHHARKFGTSKFGVSRYLKGFLDLLTVVFTTRFIKRPLHLFGGLGALFTLTGFGIDLYLSIEWALKQTSLTNRPLMLMGIAFIIVGVQLISIGLVGEMIVKNTLSQAEYSVKERL